jgi:MATE family multidrug resistance protein
MGKAAGRVNALSIETEASQVPKSWHRRLLVLAVPIVLANLTQPILSAVDTAVAGHLPGPAYLGGVALGGLFFNFVFWGFGFLRMGTTGFVAQAHGARDWPGVRAALWRAFGLAAAIGAVILMLRAPLIGLALDLFGGSAAVRANAEIYCAVRIWSAPAALANYVVLGYLLGCQHARLGLLVQVLINVVNMVAAVLFVYGFGWGVAGIGAATATADWAGLAVGLVLLYRLRRPGLPALLWRELAERTAVLRLILVNRDIFLRTLCLIASFGWFAHAGAARGDTVLAANALLLNFQTFMAYGLDGFAHAAEALVGAAIGARDRSALKSAIRVSMLWAFAGATLFSLTYALLGTGIVALLTDQAEIRKTASIYLPWAVLSPMISVWGFQLDGIFIGATRTRELRNSMALAFAGFLGAAFLLEPWLGNHGLWAALMVLMVLRAMTLGWWLGRIGDDLVLPPGVGKTGSLSMPAQVPSAHQANAEGVGR